MIKKITTEIPNSKDFDRSLNSSYSGKWYSFLSILFGVPFLWLGNDISENSQYITLFILIFSLFTLITPAVFYMKGYFRFFFFSWLVGLVTTIIFSHIVILIAYNIRDYINDIDIFIYSIFTIIYIVDLIKKREKANIYKFILFKSLRDLSFHIDIWLNGIKDTEVDQGMDFALLVMLITGGIVILAGIIFGTGLMTAKLLLNNGFDIIVEAIMSLGIFMISMLILSRFSNETLKLIAAYQVAKELTKIK